MIEIFWVRSQSKMVSESWVKWYLPNVSFTKIFTYFCLKLIGVAFLLELVGLIVLIITMAMHESDYKVFCLVILSLLLLRAFVDRGLWIIYECLKLRKYLLTEDFMDDDCIDNDEYIA